MKEFSPAEITKAREILGLPETATMASIKEQYRALCRRYHPDIRAWDESSGDKMKEINWAYELILDYCRNYRYSFRPDDRLDAEEDWWRKRFGDDPLWGPGRGQGK